MSLFTASWSRRGGACSAQTFGAVACPAEGDAVVGATPSAACVMALHLSSALRSLAVAGQCSGSCTPRSCQSWSGSCAMKCDRSAALLYAYAKSAMLAMPSSKRNCCSACGTCRLESNLQNASDSASSAMVSGWGLRFERKEKRGAAASHIHRHVWMLGSVQCKAGHVVVGVELTLVRQG